MGSGNAAILLFWFYAGLWAVACAVGYGFRVVVQALRSA